MSERIYGEAYALVKDYLEAQPGQATLMAWYSLQQRLPQLKRDLAGRVS